jgi:hypothetical protein
MKIALPTLAAVAALALGACKPAPEVVDANPDPMANQLAHAKPVELPPAIKADKTFRCKDNSLIYVTFFEGGKQASVRSAPDGPVTKLTTIKEGDAMTGDGGWKMTGTPEAIVVTRPGKGEISCKS